MSQKMSKIGYRVYFGKWCRHDNNARYSTVSGFHIHRLHNVLLTQSSSQSRRRSQHLTHQIRLFFGHQQPLFFFVRSSRPHHPGVPTLVFLPSDWIVVADCFGRVKKFVSSSAFYSFKTNFFRVGWVVVVM